MIGWMTMWLKHEWELQLVVPTQPMVVPTCQICFAHVDVVNDPVGVRRAGDSGMGTFHSHSSSPRKKQTQRLLLALPHHWMMTMLLLMMMMMMAMVNCTEPNVASSPSMNHDERMRQ